MKGNIVFLLILILNINLCSARDNIYQNISDDYLMSLSTPNGYYAYAIFPIKENRIIIANVTLLLYEYKEHYTQAYATELEFLKALYGGEIQDFNLSASKSNGVKTEKAILKEYRKYGLRYIMDKYLEESGTGNYTFKKWINNTVVSIMFANNYYVYFNDYAPNYYFRKELSNIIIPDEF